MYMNECARLHRLLKKFLLKSGLASTSIAMESQNNYYDELNQQSLAKDSVVRDQPSIAETNQTVSDLMERIGFLKNQNANLKNELNTLKQRGDIAQNQIKTLKTQNKELTQVLETQKEQGTKATLEAKRASHARFDIEIQSL